jgi:hypothetical protein
MAWAAPKYWERLQGGGAIPRDMPYDTAATLGGIPFRKHESIGLPGLQPLGECLMTHFLVRLSLPCSKNECSSGGAPMIDCPQGSHRHFLPKLS